MAAAARGKITGMPDDDENLVSDEPVEAEEAEDAEEVTDRGEGFLDKLRGSGVGTEDENVVGNVGPTDIPPGMDGDALRLESTDEPVDHLEV
jgi:hypothetical protein